MAKQTYDYDLIVIGSGAGGSVAADIVAQSGWRVALVEHNVMGGEAANWGAIPTKALFSAAHIYDLAKNNGAAFGLRSASIGYNFPSLISWKRTAIHRSGTSNSSHYYQSKDIAVLKGRAHFISPHEITLDRRHVSARYFLIATGSQLAAGGVKGLDVTPHLTPHTALDVPRPPRSLFVIGGGATGCELAQFFSIFGTKVTIAEEAARILPREDRETSELLEKAFRSRRGMNILTHTKVLRIARDGMSVNVTYLQGSDERSITVDQVLVAAGQEPCIDVGLENAGVEYSAGGIEVDNHLATTAPHIFAAGDVLGRFLYTHSAVYESRIVAHNLLHPKQTVSPDYTALPRITFTTPEIASVGMSEADCLKRDLPTSIGFAPLSIIARSNTDNSFEGFAKIIANPEGYILGATVAAPHAGEIIHELTLAIQHNITAPEIAHTLHAFPSWSEAVRVACAKVKTKKS